jgi:hypothetical protein
MRRCVALMDDGTTRSWRSWAKRPCHSSWYFLLWKVLPICVGHIQGAYTSGIKMRLICGCCRDRSRHTASLVPRHLGTQHITECTSSSIFPAFLVLPRTLKKYTAHKNAKVQLIVVVHYQRHWGRFTIENNNQVQPQPPARDNHNGRHEDGDSTCPLQCIRNRLRHRCS